MVRLMGGSFNYEQNNGNSNLQFRSGAGRNRAKAGHAASLGTAVWAATAAAKQRRSSSVHEARHRYRQMVNAAARGAYEYQQSGGHVACLRISR